jgi:hypothetical protein
VSVWGDYCFSEQALLMHSTHYHTLLLPIHDLKKRGACHFFILQEDVVSLRLGTFPPLDLVMKWTAYYIINLSFVVFVSC